MPNLKFPNNLLQRMESRRQIEPITGCWIWVGAKDKNGYGLIKIQGKMRRLTRVSLEFFKDENLGKTDQALHSCDNPPCFNPDHLRKGNAKENRAEAFAKGRITGHKMSQWFIKRSAAAKDKPDCKRGHFRTEQNTYLRPNGKRECRICMADIRLKQKGKRQR